MNWLAIFGFLGAIFLLTYGFLTAYVVKPPGHLESWRWSKVEDGRYFLGKGKEQPHAYTEVSQARFFVVAYLYPATFALGFASMLVSGGIALYRQQSQKKKLK